MTRTNCTLGSTIGRRVTASLLSAWIAATAASAQEQAWPPQRIRAGGIEFVFATAEQGRAVLKQEDLFIQKLSSFDRQVRMQTERDPGNDSFLQFVAGEVIDWPEQDVAAVRKAIELLDELLSEFELPQVGPVLLVHTTGREESGAAYTRGSAIVLPRGKTGSMDKPPLRPIAHELFHILSRSDRRWRDRLYSIIGFNATGEIKLPENLAHRRITNPDAPEVSHVIRVRLADEQTALVAPVLLAKSEFNPEKRSLFGYIDFKLMEVGQEVGKGMIPKTVNGQAVLHDPSIPDFHRQIGGNTGYIIHPEEILADNFVALVTGAKVMDEWIIEAMRRLFDTDQVASE